MSFRRQTHQLKTLRALILPISRERLMGLSPILVSHLNIYDFGGGEGFAPSILYFSIKRSSIANPRIY
jgi:hypothetical protein